MKNSISLSRPLRRPTWFASPWLVLATLALAPSCHSTAGRVEEGRYIAYEDAFSLPVPKLSVGTAVQQGLDKDISGRVVSGYVTFHDDFSNMRSIEYEKMSPAQVAALSDEKRASSYFKERFHDRFLVKVKSHFPGTRLVEEGLIKLPDGASAWFAALSVPSPEPPKPAKGVAPQPRRPDALRGFLMFPRHNLFLTVSLSNDPSGIFAPAEGEKPNEAANVERMKSDLTQLYESLRFG